MTTRTGSGSLASDAADAFRDYLAGDTGRMADLVSLLTKPLWAAARSSGLSPSQAEDVVQGAWVRLVQHADAVRDPQAVFGWLLTTVRRDAWRTAGRPAHDELPDDPPSMAAGPEVTAEEADAAHVLWQHVRALSPRCQALLRVVAFAAKPDYAAISAALGMPVGSIGPTRGRCLATLRNTLTNDPRWSQS